MRNAATEKLLSISSSIELPLTDDDFALHMDNSDPLHKHRNSFYFPTKYDGKNFTYLAGNSLGLQHVDVEQAVNDQLKMWRTQQVESIVMDSDSWSEMDQMLRKDMSSLVGASESEVVIMNSYTVNLHFMLSAFFCPKTTRKKILMGRNSFSNAIYCVASQLEISGLNPTEDLIFFAAPSLDGDYSQPNEVVRSAIDKHGDETAIIIFTAVDLSTGFFLDIPDLVKAAHAKNIIVGVDCTHAAGNVPLLLHDWDVDFGCWCTYRYLNGGPGGIGAAFVHSQHTSPGGVLNLLEGRCSQECSSSSYCRTVELKEDAAVFRVSPPSVLSLAALRPSLKLMAAVGIKVLREKSLHLTAYVELLLNELVPSGCIDLLTTVDPVQRGAQLSFRILPNKLRLNPADRVEFEGSTANDGASCDANVLRQHLLNEGVMVTCQPPDIIHIAPAPLYNSYTDVLEAIRSLGSFFKWNEIKMT